ncbi:P-loop containing nucleoside triphosphate hydrolases superfamily protein [Actinidia rufa]|uniref:P-loop containing nucleoside triphosphate hydrolases superfamily protein n=1 Tax=Actinidia rufa TaxID=165716 RepID=A0A7J0FW14_9ERIC|nr:P-loop containing nucleoside triphosphate hydrolases superfamily protein [Actinidia rufa]
MVMPSVDIISSALRKAKRVSPTKGIANAAKRERNKGAKQLDALMKELAVPLRTYKENFPNKKNLHPYERSLIELTLGDGNYEEVLGKVDALRKKVTSVGKEHASLCAKASFLVAHGTSTVISMQEYDCAKGAPLVEGGIRGLCARLPCMRTLMFLEISFYARGDVIFETSVVEVPPSLESGGCLRRPPRLPFCMDRCTHQDFTFPN